MSGGRQQILYVTSNGVLQPLAYSQVCRVLIGLARRGFRYQLLSLEATSDLADSARVRALEDELRAHEIHWTHHAYDQAGTPKAAASNLLRLGNSIRTLVKRQPIGLLHARAYHPALLAIVAKKALGVPYLFDARGRWIDERLLGGRWFTRPWVESGARHVERRLYGGASAFVTLTQLHADDIVAGDFGTYLGAPIRVITTCADFASFTLDQRRERDTRPAGAIPSDVAERLRGKLVIGFVGSTNAFYRHEESFALAQRILQRRSDTHLLIITAQQREFAALAERAGIPNGRLTLVTAPHRAMPEWLGRIDWAIQLLNSGVAKRGSMPTKLAEFFASGVRPLHFGCNPEVTDWVLRAGSGFVLGSLAPPELDRAAQHVADSDTDFATLETARERTRAHFDLARGLDTYEELLRQLGH